MKTTNQSIPTSFAPETGFALSLQTADPDERHGDDLPGHAAFDRFPLLDRNRRGIPDSALND